MSPRSEINEEVLFMKNLLIVKYRTFSTSLVIKNTFPFPSGEIPS